MFDKKRFSFNLSSGLILKFLSMVLLFAIYKEIGGLANINFTTNWLTLYTVVAALSAMDFGVGSSIKNKLIHNSKFRLSLTNLLYSYLFIGLVDLALFWTLILVGGIKFSVISNWFYVVSCLFFFLYPGLRFSISILQAKRRDWVASASFCLVNIFLYVMIIAVNAYQMDLIFYYYALYISFTIPVVITTLLCSKAILAITIKKAINFNSLYIVGAKNFFFMSAILLLMNSSNDALFNILEDSSLIKYQYGFRVLSISVIFSTIISTVIWSNLGSNLRMYSKLISTTALWLYFVALLLINIVLMFMVNPVVTIFFDLDIHITLFKLVGLASMATLLGFSFILSGFLNCLNIINKQVFALFLGLVVKFLLIFSVSNIFGSVEFIVVYVNIAAYLLIVVMYLHYLKIGFKPQRGIANV
ncbi:hypothetical protein N9E26_01010 [bacterium]|nr:hypothetical protein [bacterium]